MWLEKILGRSKQLDEVIITIQKVITYTLIFLLIFLVVYNAFGDTENSKILNNSYLPVVSGWIGIILGFYFSREIADMLNRKLKESQKQQREDTIKLRTEYEEYKKQTTGIITDILNEKEKITNGDGKRQKKQK